MNDFVENGILTEEGFHCVHRRQKMYIVPNKDDKVDAWPLLHAKYEWFEHLKKIRKTKDKTFLK